MCFELKAFLRVQVVFNRKSLLQDSQENYLIQQKCTTDKGTSKGIEDRGPSAVTNNPQHSTDNKHKGPKVQFIH